MIFLPASLGLTGVPGLSGDPLALPGLRALYDGLSERRANADGGGALVTTHGANFRWWQDRSPNGLHASSAAGATLNVAGSDRSTFFNLQSLSANWSPGSINDYSIHALVRRATADLACIVALESGGGQTFVAVPWTLDTVQAPGTTAGSEWLGFDGDAALVSCVRSGTTVTISINANPVTTITGNTTVIVPNAIQMGRFGPSSFYRSYLTSLAICDAAHPQAQTYAHYTWLRGQYPTEFARSQNLLVYVGNSLGTGQFAGLPTHLVPKVHGGGYAPNVTHWLNASVGGKSTTQMLADYLTRIVPLVDTTTGRVVFFVWEATNDMVSPNLLDGPAAAANVFSLVQALKAAVSGCRVVVGTVLDRNPADWPTKKTACNALLTSAANQALYGYRVADFTGVLQVSSDGAYANATYFYDGIHIKPAGYDLLAPIVGAAVELELAA